MVFGSDPSLLYDLVKRCRSAADRAGRPLMVKLSPNVTSIARMARVAQEAGGAGDLVGEHVSGAGDRYRDEEAAHCEWHRRAVGPAIRPIAVRMVHEAAQAVTIPVVGMGGIVRAEDAVEFLLAGATAVEVGTASFADPRAVENIANGLRRWCAEHEVAHVSELTGAMGGEASG